MAQEVLELHALLDAAGVSRPLVLVGHSIGGLLVRKYTEAYPDEVAGLVLVDPTHESEMLFNLRVNRWVRLRELATDRVLPEPQFTGPAVGDDSGEDFTADDFQQIFLSRQANPQPLGIRNRWQ